MIETMKTTEQGERGLVTACRFAVGEMVDWRPTPLDVDANTVARWREQYGVGPYRVVEVRDSDPGWPGKHAPYPAPPSVTIEPTKTPLPNALPFFADSWFERSGGETLK